MKLEKHFRSGRKCCFLLLKTVSLIKWFQFVVYHTNMLQTVLLINLLLGRKGALRNAFFTLHSHILRWDFCCVLVVCFLF